ncbi:hypothetical protein CAEBREN_00380 [Caenorhabditis brenneri]|uniref:Uncharacterized protein n=1 Tax=Caenorhabditis brenneri TaxID=135651 RepID=G0N9L1_CAEBE|nr:hypothetical protein CAEBREN_00380 [Caenorhabditis brenneri]
MSAHREFSHITLSSTPFKMRMDQEAMKSETDIEKDRNIAYKCADRFNYNTNLLRKVSLSDRFELAALGFELKGKPKSNSEKIEKSENLDYIYRKEKRQDFAGSPLPVGMSPSNPLPAGRGFLSPAIQAAGAAFGFGSPKVTPQKSMTNASPRKPIRSIFDDIPTNIA